MSAVIPLNVAAIRVSGSDRDGKQGFEKGARIGDSRHRGPPDHADHSMEQPPIRLPAPFHPEGDGVAG